MLVSFPVTCVQLATRNLFRFVWWCGSLNTELLWALNGVAVDGQSTDTKDVSVVASHWQRHLFAALRGFMRKSLFFYRAGGGGESLLRWGCTHDLRSFSAGGAVISHYGTSSKTRMTTQTRGTYDLGSFLFMFPLRKYP